MQLARIGGGERTLTIRTRINQALKGSIRIRIWLSVTLCIVAVGVVALSNLKIMSQTAALPKQLYDGPYAVGLAVRDLKADVAVMHSELSTLAGAPSRLALRRFEKRMADIDQRAIDLQQTISSRFVGNQELVAAAFAAHSAWNTVRTQVVQFILNEDPIAAYTLTKTEGYNQLKYLNESLHRLVDAANTHSRQLNENASVLLRVAEFQGLLAVLVALLFLGGAAALTNSIVVRPVREISEALQSIAKGNLSTAIPHEHRTDEIGLIASSSKVFLKHAIDIQESSIDLLTGVPKRHQMIDHITNCDRAGLQKNTSSFLLHVDIDGFAEVNDVFGRDFGDNLLIFAANRLRSLMKPNDFLAREGADSFVWYRKESASQDEAISLAERIQALFDEPMLHNEQEFRGECSIGIVFDDGGVSAEVLLVRAENALIDSKRQSGRSISTYTEEMDARLLRRRETLRGLRFAIAHHEIVPFFQPQVDTKTGALSGFECLVRWNHPEHGMMAPWQFLPIAQSAGLLGNITDIMIDRSLKQLSDWREAGIEVPRVSLNLDASDLEREGFADHLMLEIDKHGLVPGDVCLELLETAMIEDGDNIVSQTLARLGQLGFPIELDDFGTGHAAISSLQLIALNGIKIDRSFVTKLHERPGQLKLTRAMLRLAHAMQIQTIAEGVETMNERRLLLELGCDVIQGFGIGKPMAADDATLWLEKFTPGVGRMDEVNRVA